MKSTGITTQSFINAILSGQTGESDVLRLAKTFGLDFVEIRNKGHLQASDVERLAAQASLEGIRLHYGWDIGSLFDTDYLQVYQAQLACAQKCGSGAICRVVMDPSRISQREQPVDYTTEETALLEARVAEVNKMAADMDLTLAFENAWESPKGYFGMLDRIAGMRATLDTANFLNLGQQRTRNDAREVLALSTAHRAQIPYVHVKSTRNAVLLDTVVADGDFDWKAYAESRNDGSFCIEFPAADSFEESAARTERSIKALHELFA